MPNDEDEHLSEDDMLDEEPLDYDEMKIFEPERETEEGKQAVSLSEAEEETGTKTDIRAILDILTPKFTIKELDNVLQPAMVSRIPSDNLLDKMKLLVLRELQRHEPTDKIDVIEIISWTHDALFIGLNGMGIADRLELAGVLHEEDMEKMSKELGLGG